jgi:glycosyltransferase involved in cell wall biosynthesis/peptidoglycan/xylan/chitin deacetylase (PgdA/CDA1 family)
MAKLSFLGQRRQLTVLQFHRVPADGSVGESGELHFSAFKQLIEIAQTSMTVVSLPDALKQLREECLPDRAVAFSFDDGYVEWNDHVAPLLQSRGLPATFFVTTGPLAGGRLWHERIEDAVMALPAQGVRLPGVLRHVTGIPDLAFRRSLIEAVQAEFKYLPLEARDRAIADLESQATLGAQPFRPFTADHVRDLHQRGFTIGAHSVEHPILTRVDKDRAHFEIATSKRELEDIIDAPVTLFAYPNGRPRLDYNADHVEIVKRCGFDAAFMTGGGAAAPGHDAFQIPRFSCWSHSPFRTPVHIARNARRVAVPVATQRAEPTKVLLVENGAGFGGAVVAASTLVRAMDQREIEYHVTSNVPLPSFAPAGALVSYKVISDRVLDCRRWLRSARRALPGRSFRVVAFFIGRVDDLVNRLPYFVRLAVHVAKVRPDVIHGNNEPYSNRESLFVARLFGIPFVQHIRGNFEMTTQTAYLLARIRCFVPVSRWLGGELISRGVAPRFVHHVYDGVDLHRGPLRSESLPLRSVLDISPSRPLVGLVGMLVPWKGQRLFVQAIRDAVAKGCDACFLVIGAAPQYGDHDYERQLREESQDLVDAGHLVFTGHRDDVLELMQQLDVLISASMQPEPLGLVMLEGIAAGSSFVGPDHGAAVEVTEALGHGLLFRNGEASSLAQTIIEALQARSRASTQAAAARVRELFDAQACAQRTVEVYRACLDVD